jgi:hypothetical protein
MSLSRETILELMALADGELHGGARERAERLVADNEEARRIVEAMRAPELGAWLGEAVQGRSAAADGVADAVMATIASQGAASIATDGSASAPAHEGGGVVRLAAPHRRRTAWVPAMTVVALAAGVALVLRSIHRDEAAEPAPVASIPMPTPSLGSATPVASASAPLSAGPIRSVEVEEIDSPSRGVSVFEIPLGNAAAAAGAARPSSVVIWIDDEPRSP